MAKLKIGDRAPDFTLKSSTGETVTLSGFFGKKNVVLFFYPRDEGPTCVK
jgi:peroxiredoxin